MTHLKNRSSGWRIAAALIAVAGVVGSVQAQQGRVRGGGGPRPSSGQPQDQQAPRYQQPAAAPREQQAPKQQQPVMQPRQQQSNPPPRPVEVPQQPPSPRPAVVSRPAAPTPPPAQTPAPKSDRPVIRPAAPAPTAPSPKSDKPVTPPVVTKRPEPSKPTAPPVVTKRPEPSKPTTPPVVTKRPEPSKPTTPPVVTKRPEPSKPTAPPVVTKRPEPSKPTTPPVVTKRPEPSKPTAPPVVTKRPEPSKPTTPVVTGPKTQEPKNNLNKPIATTPATKPPVIGAQPAPKPGIIKGTRPAKIVKTDLPPSVGVPSNGLVKTVPGGLKPVDPIDSAPKADRQPRVAGSSPTLRRTNGLVVPAAAAGAGGSVAFRDDITFDSGLVRSNGLERQISHGSGYDNSYGPGYVVNGYSCDDYPWRNCSYVSYSSGYCAPSPCYPRWPYYSSPFYGSSLCSATIVYSSYDPWCVSRYYVPCPPTYTYCGPTYYSYCPPTYYTPSYCDDNWSFSFGFSGSSSWFGFGYSSGYSYPSYSYPSYDCYAPCYRPYRYSNGCAPGYGWWRRPVWGWSTYSCDPWSCAEPRGPVYPFPVNETGGAYGLTQAASIDATQQFEEAVYSTMRGNYQTAIDATRQAVLDAPESFAPGASDLDRYQLQRATWALTVYENPPRAAVEDRDAAFMVAAIAALSGDHDRAREAVNEARQLGDDHPATLQLIEKLAMDDARTDWGVQTTMR